MRSSRALQIMLTSLLIGSSTSVAQEASVSPDMIYGHKYGLALTLDAFQPPKPNGAGVLFMVSGGWYSNWAPAEKMRPLFDPLLKAGFTVFAVRHGSSPKFSIPEAVEDVRRSVRFVRHNAERFGVDPQRLGVYGASAGGHLSLMLGTAADDGDAGADDPLLRVSDRVQAVVALVAPTDLRIMVWEAPGHLPAYERFPALDLELDEARQHSPLIHVTADDAPTLLIVGDQDELVPMHHSQQIQTAFEQQHVPNRLLILEGAGHGFQGDDQQQAVAALVQWFEEHLTAK